MALAQLSFEDIRPDASSKDQGSNSLKTIRIAEADYTVSDSAQLREDVIKMRDEALQENDFTKAVQLSHVIAFMAIAITVMW